VLTRRRLVVGLTLAALAAVAEASAQAILTLPRRDGSVRFAVIGDTGRGSREQYEVAAQMTAFHKEYPFTFVIMLGDNIYGSDTPGDMARKFSTPYQPLIEAGVRFQASLGNHDNPNQRFYRPFNMDGQRYYSFRASKSGLAKLTDIGVSFFAIDSNYLDKTQLEWLDKELSASKSDWKIAFFHHPLYSSGRTHGSSLEARAVLEPLFLKHGVGAVFAGHDHFYERTKPQKGGIVHWVSGAGGSLRKGDVRASQLTAKAFDRDYHFMLVEIAGDDLFYQAISRTGATIDSGVLHRPGAAVAAASPPPGPAAIPVAVPHVAPTGRTTPEGAAGEAQPPRATPTTTPASSPTPKPKPSPTEKPEPSPTPPAP